ncbi:MAG: hypothetical protein JWQ29_1974 [Phenylobacterium sp.]|nr:hypothetical protein [Phenylobacterium sp.]
MTSVPVFVVANVVIDDFERYRPYRDGFMAILKQYGGKVLAIDDEPETLEGDAPLDGRFVVLQFASEAEARTWYESSEYQSLSEHRRAGTTTRFLGLVHQLPPRA